MLIKRSVLQLVVLLSGVVLLLWLFYSGKNSGSQVVTVNSTNAVSDSVLDKSSAEPVDVSNTPEVYNSAVLLFNNISNADAKAMVTAALGIDSLASLISEQNLIDDLQKKSESLLQSALKKDPNNEAALNNLALIDIYRRQDVMSGVQKLLKVVESNPSNEEALYQLGILAIKSGQVNKAIERFEKLVSLQPQNKEYHKNLALLYNQTGDTKKAEKHAAIAR